MSRKIIGTVALVMALILTLSLTAFAENIIRDSVEYKDAPEYKDPGFDIIITPYSKESETKDDKLEDNMKNLRESYKELEDADKITEVVDEGDLRESIGLKKDGEYDVNRLKVDDVFDVYTEKSGSWELTLEKDFDKDDVGAVIFKPVDGDWVVLDYTDNGDGTITIKLDGNGTIAFLVDNGGKTDPGYSADTADYSDMTVWTTVLCAAVVGMAVVAISFKATKKKENA